MHRPPRRLASWICATLFATMATYHFFTLLDAEMPHAAVLRHLVFVVVDAAFAALVWWWPRWLLVPISILTVEQFRAHGGSVWRSWHKGEFDPLGTITLAGLAILCLLLVKDEFKRFRS